MIEPLPAVSEGVKLRKLIKSPLQIKIPTADTRAPIVTYRKGKMRLTYWCQLFTNVSNSLSRPLIRKTGHIHWRWLIFINNSSMNETSAYLCHLTWRWKPFTIGLGVCEQTEFGMLIFHDVSSIFQKGGGFNLSSILSEYLVRHIIWTLEKRDSAVKKTWITSLMWSKTTFLTHAESLAMGGSLVKTWSIIFAVLFCENEMRISKVFFKIVLEMETMIMNSRCHDLRALGKVLVYRKGNVFTFCFIKAFRLSSVLRKTSVCLFSIEWK